MAFKHLSLSLSLHFLVSIINSFSRTESNNCSVGSNMVIGLRLRKVGIVLTFSSFILMVMHPHFETFSAHSGLCQGPLPIQLSDSVSEKWVSFWLLVASFWCLCIHTWKTFHLTLASTKDLCMSSFALLVNFHPKSSAKLCIFFVFSKVFLVLTLSLPLILVVFFDFSSVVCAMTMYMLDSKKKMSKYVSSENFYGTHNLHRVTCLKSWCIIRNEKSTIAISGVSRGPKHLN